MPNRISKAWNTLSGKDVKPVTPPKVEIGLDSKLEQLMATYMGKLLKNPDPILTDNQDNESEIDLYWKMAIRDMKISSALQTRVSGVTSKRWHVESGSEEESDTQNAQIIEFDILGRIKNFEQDIKDMLGCVRFGFSPTEVIWGYDEKTKLIIPTALKARDPKYFQFEIDTHRLMIKSAQDYEGKPVPEYKFIVTQNEPEFDNPYGTSVLRDCYWYYWFKKLGVKFWAIAIERYGSPLRKMSYPKAIQDENVIASYEEKNQNLDNFGTCITMPDDMDVQLLQATKQAGGDQDKFTDYIDRQIAQRILGQTQTSDGGSGGSYAKAVIHNEIRQDILENDAKIVQQGMNQLLEWIYFFNWGEPKYNYPTFKIEYEPDVDRETNLAIMVGASKELRLTLRTEQVYNDLNLEQPTEDDTPETLLEPAPIPEPLDIKPDDDKGNPDDDKDEPDDDVKLYDRQGHERIIADQHYVKHDLNKIYAEYADGINKVPDGLTITEKKDAFMQVILTEADKKKFAEDPTFLNNLINVPPEGTATYKIGSIVSIQERFKKKLDKLFADIASDLPDILRKAGVDYDHARAILDDYLRDNYENVLRGYITKADTEAFRFAIYDMAGQLAMTISKAKFETLYTQFLSDHFYEFGKIERITGMKNTMRDTLLKEIKDAGGIEANLDDVVKAMTEKFPDIAANKIKQISWHEPRVAANKAVIKIGKQMPVPMEAWFGVDPASCPICQEWAMRNPYTLQEADNMGMPHVGCNDYWFLTKMEGTN